MPDINEKGNTLFATLSSVAGQLLLLIIIAVAGICVKSYNQVAAIEDNKQRVLAMEVVVNRVNTDVSVLATKMASRDTDIVKLQNAVDKLNIKVASIPNRQEFNESLNNLYNRLTKNK